MTRKLSVIVLFSFLCQSWTCKLMKNSVDIQFCESWEEFTKAGSHPEWKKLVLKNTANLEKKPLKDGAFKNVPNLENLLIEGLVNKVEAGVFKDLPKLKELHLFENEIEELPQGILTGLHINVLEIKHSHLKKIYPDTFNKIDFVNLEGNQINPGTIFKNSSIGLLDLSNNSISKLEDCAFCGSIKSLKLHDNLLTSFDPVRILGENSPILGIGLDKNKLIKMPKFNSFPNLTGVSFSYNFIEKIEDNSFADCPNFSVLEVSFNKLKDIPANVIPEFGDREDPFFLVIHGNQIQCLSKELRDKIKKLRRVTVNDNPWKCECLRDVIAWAKDRKAWVGCEFANECDVPCMDKNNKQQIISMPNH